MKPVLEDRLITAGQALHYRPWFTRSGSTLDTKTVADDIYKGDFRLNNSVPNWKFQLPLDWADDPFRDGNWQMSLHAFYMLDPIIMQHKADNNPKHLEFGLLLFKDWVHWHKDNNTIWSWYNMSVGIRSAKLSWLYSMLCQRDEGLSKEDDDFLITLCQQHVDRVINGDVELRMTNHGLFQIHGLITLLHAVPGLRNTEQAYNFARDNLNCILEAQFDHDRIHKEHSPGYHDFVIKLIRFFIESGLYERFEKLQEIYAQALEHQFWLVDPSARHWCIGDTGATKEIISTQATKLNAKPVGVIAMKNFDFGYVSIKSAKETPPENGSGMFIMGAFHSEIHKHLDDLTFEWFEFGKRLIIDSASNGYKQGPERRYLLSTRAHNTVEIDGQSYSRRKEHAYGSAIESANEVNGVFIVEAKAPHTYLNAVHSRRFELHPGKELIIRDKITFSDEPRNSVQWFHIHPDAKLLSDDDDGTVFELDDVELTFQTDANMGKIIKNGATTPDMQGWYSPGLRKIVPNYALGFRMLEIPITTRILVRKTNKAD